MQSEEKMSRNRYGSSPIYGKKKVQDIENRSQYERSAAQPIVLPAPPLQADTAPSYVGTDPAQQAAPVQTLQQALPAEPAYRQQQLMEQYAQQQPVFMQPSNLSAPVSRPMVKKKRGWLLAILTFALPLLFLLYFIVFLNDYSWGWIFGSLFLLAIFIFIPLMWILKAFSRNARTNLSAIYGALTIVVSLCLVLGFVNANDDNISTGTNTPYNQNAQNNASYTDQYNTNTTITQTASTPGPTESSTGVSTAAETLQLFISYWQNTQYEACVNLCRPDWRNRQQNPQKTLFSKLGDCTPISHTIEKADGTEADSSRTVTVLIKVRNQLMEETYKRYEVLMLKLNNTWYVDPDSLSGITVSTEELVKSDIIHLTTPPITATPKPTANPQMVLYYNPDGGKYYHKDKKCYALDSKNQKLLQPFYYYELNNSPYKSLKCCTKCGAPSRPQ